MKATSETFAPATDEQIAEWRERYGDSSLCPARALIARIDQYREQVAHLEQTRLRELNTVAAWKEPIGELRSWAFGRLRAYLLGEPRVSNATGVDEAGSRVPSDRVCWCGETFGYFTHEPASRCGIFAGCVSTPNHTYLDHHAPAEHR